MVSGNFSFYSESNATTLLSNLALIQLLVTFPRLYLDFLFPSCLGFYQFLVSDVFYRLLARRSTPPILSYLTPPYVLYLKADRSYPKYNSPPTVVVKVMQ